MGIKTGDRVRTPATIDIKAWPHAPSMLDQCGKAGVVTRSATMTHEGRGYAVCEVRTDDGDSWWWQAAVLESLEQPTLRAAGPTGAACSRCNEYNAYQTAPYTCYVCRGGRPCV